MAERPTAGRLARKDVVTCRLDARVDEVRARVEQSTYGFALVTTEQDILLGRLRKSALEPAADGATAESIMEPGPSTVRPDIPAAELAERLAQRNLRTAVVNSPDGQLIGVVRRRDLESAAD
jgi:CBS domain-containing protein